MDMPTTLRFRPADWDNGHDAAVRVDENERDFVLLYHHGDTHGEHLTMAHQTIDGDSYYTVYDQDGSTVCTGMFGDGWFYFESDNGVARESRVSPFIAAAQVICNL